jgi:hypothetical protein
MDANNTQTIDAVAKPELLHHPDHIGQTLGPTPLGSDVVLIFDLDEVSALSRN